MRGWGREGRVCRVLHGTSAGSWVPLRVTFTCTDTDPVPFSETLTSVFPTEIQQVDSLGLMRSAAAENVASLVEK